MAWLTGWDNRKSHNINSAVGAGTNYQVRITVHYGAGSDSGEDVYCNSKCKTDFGDIRFTDNDETTELDYWMEEKTDSDYAVFWVEVADDLSSNQSIYVYYGNAGATYTDDYSDQEHIENTFLLGDHFDDAVLDTARWDETGNGSVALNASILEVTGWVGTSTKVAHTVTSDNAFGATIRLRGKLKFFQLATGIYDYFGMRNTDVDNMIVANYITTKRVQNRQNSSGSHITYINTAINSYFTIEILCKSGDQVDYDFDNGTETVSHITDAFVPDSAMNIWMQADKDISAQAEVYVDWVFIAKYVSPEPAHSTWGSEEPLLAAAAGLNLPQALPVILGGYKNKKTIIPLFKSRFPKFKPRVIA